MGALKLDIETNYNMKLMDDHPPWPWVIEYAGQTLHMFHINREDGLAPSQRIRGETCTTPRARIGEKVLYKTVKTGKLNDDTEKRWRYGIWLGVIKTSDEHIFGTANGVVKCSAVAQIANDTKFDAEFFAAIALNTVETITQTQLLEYSHLCRRR